MDKKLYKRYIENFDINLLDCRPLGEGHNGIVYLLPEGKVIKICYEANKLPKGIRYSKKNQEKQLFPSSIRHVGKLHDKGLCRWNHSQ